MNEGWAIQISRPGKPEVLRKITIPIEAPKDDEVGIQVKACGVNFADIVMRLGQYMDAPPMPFIPGYEVAGLVDKVGKNVTDFKPGDRVLGATYFGGYCSYVCVPSDKVRHLPEHISFNEGAGIPVIFLTAYVALHQMSRIQAGDRVLIHGVAGGVGLAALQLAKNRGCIVYGTAGSQKKLDYAKEMGLDYGINYREQDFVTGIRAISGHTPLDVILDPVGGENVAKNLSLLDHTGRVVVFGASSMVQGETSNLLAIAKAFLSMRKIDLIPLMHHNRGIFGLNALKLWNKEELVKPAIDNIMKDFAENKLKLVVSETFPLERAADAHRYLHDRKNIGKVVLTI